MTGLIPAYKVVVKPSVERREQIAAHTKPSIDLRPFYHYKSKEHRLPVVRLPVDLPIYRVGNARTRDAQLSQIAKGQHPEKFFDTSQQEDEDVQQVQHTILTDFSHRGQGEGIVAIFEELKTKGIQTEPILITSGGVVVNGNRRVAAMRELSLSGESHLKELAHVNCMVLPPEATEDDLLEIEFKLQMARETKLPYSWTNEARVCKQLRDVGKSIAFIASMKEDDPKEVDKLIAMYELAERYLSEWLGAPNDFDRLEGTRQAFKQMATRRNPKRPAPQRLAAEAFHFFIVENREALEDRAYRFINSIESDPPSFFDSYAKLAQVELPSPTKMPPGPMDDLEILLPQPAGAEQRDPTVLIDVLKKARGAKAQAAAALDAIESAAEMVDANKNQSGDSPLKYARAALKKLNSVDVAKAGPKTRAELKETLEHLESLASSLIKQIGS